MISASPADTSLMPSSTEQEAGPSISSPATVDARDWHMRRAADACNALRTSERLRLASEDARQSQLTEHNIRAPMARGKG